MPVTFFYAITYIAIITTTVSSQIGNIIGKSENMTKALYHLQRSGTQIESHTAVAKMKTTITNCAQACLATKDCSSFAYLKVIKQIMNCILVSKANLDTANFVRNKLWDFYQMLPDIRCNVYAICGRFKSYQKENVEDSGCNHISSTIVSKGKSAFQSSTEGNSIALKALDGNYDGNIYAGSCSHTAVDDPQPWWRVDLVEEHYVSSIAITGRKDCCSERLDYAQLRVGMSLQNNGTTNSLCTATTVKIAAGQTKKFPCDQGCLFGRYVTISFPRPGVITLCEVEIWGFKV